MIYSKTSIRVNFSQKSGADGMELIVIVLQFESNILLSSFLDVSQPRFSSRLHNNFEEIENFEPENELTEPLIDSEDLPFDFQTLRMGNNPKLQEKLYQKLSLAKLLQQVKRWTIRLLDLKSILTACSRSYYGWAMIYLIKVDKARLTFSGSY